MHARRAALVSALTVTAALLVACVPPRGPSRGPVATSIATAPPLGAASPDADPLRAPPPLEPVVMDPEAVAALRASQQQPALPLTDVVLQPGLTTIALLDTTRAEARGLLAEGGIRHVMLEEGQRASTPLDLRQGECLTVIVHAGLGVREVDAFVVAPAAPGGDVLAQDGVGGPIAIVGGMAGCFRPPRTERVEVVVLARKGRGSVLAAIFRGPPG